MAYKVAGDVLRDRMKYLNFLGNNPYRYLEYKLDTATSPIKNIVNVYLLSIGFATNLSLCYKLSSDDEFIKINISLPECGCSDIYVNRECIEHHIIKSINDYDTKNNTNIMDQLSQLNLFDARCIVDIKKPRIEIFKSTQEYLDYHKPLNHIYLDIHVDRSKL